MAKDPRDRLRVVLTIALALLLQSVVPPTVLRQALTRESRSASTAVRFPRSSRHPDRDRTHAPDAVLSAPASSVEFPESDSDSLRDDEVASSDANGVCAGMSSSGLLRDPFADSRQVDPAVAEIPPSRSRLLSFPIRAPPLA